MYRASLNPLEALCSPQTSSSRPNTADPTRIHLHMVRDLRTLSLTHTLPQTWRWHAIVCDTQPIDTVESPTLSSITGNAGSWKKYNKTLIKYALFNRRIYLAHKSEWTNFKTYRLHPVLLASLIRTGLVDTFQTVTVACFLCIFTWTMLYL